MQTVEAWNEFSSLGYLIGSSVYAGFKNEYHWMMDQMKKRLVNYSGEYPIWVSLQEFNSLDVSGYVTGKQYVKLELEIDNQDVLVSNFSKWNECVLNNLCFFDSEQEEYIYQFAEDEGLDKEDFKKLTWERIFDPSRFGNSVLQGTTGKVDTDKVKNVEYFVAR
ncbi:DUF3841 domain-containing protein [Paenibacillus vulneris]|uniref:DUF3841 domain-containing protein n=1 Tax=Paenibacillus vulneris TaxID=1133364 RepID=A0ABW3UJ89_9BACL